MENYQFKEKFSNVGKGATKEMNENGLVWNATMIAPYIQQYKWNEAYNSDSNTRARLSGPQKSTLRSARSSLKKNRKYCLNIELNPMTVKTHFRIELFWVNKEHRMVSSHVRGDWFTEPHCIEKKEMLDEKYKGKYDCMKFPDPESENIDSLVANNFQNISFSIWPKYDYLELEMSVFKGTALGIKNINIEDCSKVPEHLKPENITPRATLPDSLPSTTSVPTTETSTTIVADTNDSMNNVEIVPNIIVSQPEQKPDNLKLTDLLQKLQVNLKKAEEPASTTEGNPKSVLGKYPLAQFRSYKVTYIVLGSTTVTTPKLDTTRPTLPADWGKPDKQALESATTESAIIATTELLEDLLVLTTQSGELVATFRVQPRPRQLWGLV